MTDKERGDIATRFKAGNQFWKARSSHGIKPLFSEPEQFAAACYEYFAWCDENPLVTWKPFVTRDGEVSQMEQIYPRPYTQEGLYIFLDISRSCFNDYKVRPDFASICENVLETIRNQKLSGAIAGYYNHAIVARDLGLKESSEVKLEAPQGIVFNVNYKGE